MGLSIGIVGLPNVGKSTLFTALTKKGGMATKYPFASKEANIGTVPVPDVRLDALAAIVKPTRIMPATVEFVDVAGLVKGANDGEGMGNQFLASIRETDAIIEVLRCFTDDEVVHVTGTPDPANDSEIIKMELILADLGTIERALPRLEKDAKRNKTFATKVEVVRAVQEWLDAGNRAISFDFAKLSSKLDGVNNANEARAHIYDLHLLTMKPLLYVANIDESKLGDAATEAGAMAPIDGIEPIQISAKIEADIAELAESSPEDAAIFIEELGLTSTSLERLIQSAYALLGLQSYFTAGDFEVKAWTIPIGSKAPQAAGVIHSDFEKGFIKAETISYEDYIAHGGEAGCKAVGRLRIEGKEYVVQDGDVMHFRFAP
ncbi:MAG: redox-regulated ATPase YchF [Coriobacteriia bacterium]|nr:redox-regulated ATPase YchF [Coriobacteriia bacterium]